MISCEQTFYKYDNATKPKKKAVNFFNKASVDLRVVDVMEDFDLYLFLLMAYMSLFSMLNLGLVLFLSPPPGGGGVCGTLITRKIDVLDQKKKGK